jgi:hypothetical protein
MIKRPLDSRFSAAVRAGVKMTTIRAKAWPVGKLVMLYNWTGSPYRSKQSDVAAVEILASSEIQIRHGDVMQYQISGTWHIGPLWKTEAFKSQAEMDEWFRKVIRP